LARQRSAIVTSIQGLAITEDLWDSVTESADFNIYFWSLTSSITYSHVKGFSRSYWKGTPSHVIHCLLHFSGYLPEDKKKTVYNSGSVNTVQKKCL